MKKLLHILTVMLAASVISSCNSVSDMLGGTKMDTEDATRKVAETLKKNIDFNEWKIYRLAWMEGEELENQLQVVVVEMINRNNDCFMQSFLLSGPGAGNISDLSEAGGMAAGHVLFDKTTGITLDMVDPAAIQKQYDAAKAMIPEGYTFQSIASYTFRETMPSGSDFLDRDKNLGEIVASFCVNVTEDGKEQVTSAGKTSIQYYEVTFNVLPDGSVEMAE